MNLRDFKKLYIGGIELKQLFINGIQVWKSGFKNWVLFSIDTDGSIYQNGKGYLDGYRLSSSGSISAQGNTVTTGFIPCTSTDLIRMAGVTWKSETGYSYLAFYDANFSLLGSLNCYAKSANSSGYASARRGIVAFKNSGYAEADIHPREENGVVIFDHYTFSSDANKVAYFRLSGRGKGSDMIVTVNEEIA